MPTLENRLLRGRSILVVDDHDAHRHYLVDILRGLGADVDQATGGNEALAKMANKPFDLALLDLRMDDMDGLEVLKRARERQLARNYTMMSAEGTIASAVEAIHLGASDFLVKPFEPSQLVEVVRRVLKVLPDTAEQRDPRLAWRDKFAPGFAGEHPSLLEVFLVLERIANTDCTVLVLGESGTGKELVARAIHCASNRAKRPFVPVNCGAIPETLIESELFGHARGAFSGAVQAREGRFAAADSGTLFLDEIGEMSLSVQVKFLRVLQEHEYVPVGEARPRKCDVRIVAATNKNLERMAEQGSFRPDLFYRLNLIPVHLPPLRDRRSDIPLLAKHFLSVFNQRRGRELVGFTDDAIELLREYHWPGNVRELENSVERMTLLHQGDGVLAVEDLPTKIQFTARVATLRSVSAEPLLEATDAGISAIASTVVPTTTTDPSSIPSPAVLLPAAAESGQASNRADEDEEEDAFDEREHGSSTGNGIHADSQADGSGGWGSPAGFRLPVDGIDLRKAVEMFEDSLIRQALERTAGNKNRASILLGMNRTTLVEKLRKRRQRVGEG